MFSKQILLISLISFQYFWQLSRSVDFDPDIDVCNDPNFDAGVVTDQIETYLFKGPYFWKMRSLAGGQHGIVGYANYTSAKWPEITDKISLAFTVKKDNKLMTNNVWIGYQSGVKVMTGKTDSWNGFNGLNTTSCFTVTMGGPLVFILHSLNTKYVLMDFTNILSPKKVKTGITTIRDNILIFAANDSKQLPVTGPGSTIRNLVDVKVGLTYKDQLFLLSKRGFCAVNLEDDPFERECVRKPIKLLLACPLDLSERPRLLTTTPTTTISATISAATMAATKIKSTVEITPIGGNIFDGTSGGISDDNADIDPDSDNIDAPIADQNQEPVTGVPVLGRELDESDENSNSSGKGMSAAVEAEIFDKNAKNSMVWMIVFSVIFITIVISSLLMIGIVYKLQKKRPKGDVYYIK